ncbi:hypothetical protein ACJJTC_003544 [Scirpophaga incertulas]
MLAGTPAHCPYQLTFKNTIFHPRNHNYQWQNYLPRSQYHLGTMSHCFGDAQLLLDSNSPLWPRHCVYGSGVECISVLISGKLSRVCVCDQWQVTSTGSCILVVSALRSSSAQRSVRIMPRERPDGHVGLPAAQPIAAECRFTPPWTTLPAKT